MKCIKCKYEWKARIKNPRQCPNCKRQIKYKDIGKIKGRPAEGISK